jgi:hypothetical protein
MGNYLCSQILIGHIINKLPTRDIIFLLSVSKGLQMAILGADWPRSAPNEFVSSSSYSVNILTESPLRDQALKYLFCKLNNYNQALLMTILAKNRHKPTIYVIRKYHMRILSIPNYDLAIVVNGKEYGISVFRSCLVQLYKAKLVRLFRRIITSISRPEDCKFPLDLFHLNIDAVKAAYKYDSFYYTLLLGD